MPHPQPAAVAGDSVAARPRWSWADTATSAGIWLVLGLATPRWTGLDTPDSSFYLSLSLFGSEVTDRAPVDSYWWTRLGFIAPNRLLAEVLGPWAGFAAYRMILLLAIVAGSMVLLRRFTSLPTAAALTAMITCSTVVLSYLGNPYLTGSVLAGLVALLACAQFDRVRAAVLAGAILGWLAMVNPPGFLLAGTLWIAVRIHRQRVAAQPWRPALGHLGIAAAVGVGTFAAFLLAGAWIFPGMDWFEASLRSSGIDLANFASTEPVWLGDASLLVPLAGLVVAIATWAANRTSPPARMALLISATSIGFMLTFSPLMGGIALEAPMYQAMLWPPALLALALAAASVIGDAPWSRITWAVAIIGIAAIALAGRWPGAWSGVACLVAMALLVAVAIAGLRLAGRTKWPAAIALAAIAALLAGSQLVQNSRGPLGLYYLSPYSWALRANPIEAKARVAVNAQQWLLDRTEASDRILVWVGGDWVGGDRELYVVAGMQLWGGENLVTLAPTLDEPGAAKLDQVRPTVISMVAPTTEQVLAFWRSLPASLKPSQPQCYDATWQASPNEPTWVNPAPVAAVHSCLTRLTWPAETAASPRRLRQVSQGPALWQRAKQRIPGGSMLLSKRAEMFLPADWPAYFSRARGCTVWDLDDRPYLDLGLMGVGTNILGYGYPTVDEAVRRVVDQGNLSSLNAPEEVALAETLVELHPWADMVRYARSGGETCAIAIRIARAASGRDKVAFCGYHGWHDWYLAANLAEDDSLDGHLLPGLQPNGVPRALRGTSMPFRYNDLAGLAAMLQQDPGIGVIYMEVQRSDPPAAGFLQGVRELATAHGAVLVFDECTSGFRRTLGGLHLHYGVEPDIATFGKTLGNGYAITAVIGREEVMQAAQTTFISSTFWTERIGPAAALAALAAMAEEDAPARVHGIGEQVQQRWAQVAAEVGLGLVTGGLPALANFTPTHLPPLAVKTYVTKRMLEQGYLAGNSMYASIAHTDQVLDDYFDALAPVFAELAGMDEQALARQLPQGTAHGGFARLT